MVRLIPAKCPSCGASLQFPDNLEVGYCSHCGGKVLIDKDKMEVHHTGAVSSLPLCPNCGNTLTEGNRVYTCDLCRKKICYVCSKKSQREVTHFNNAIAQGRVVHNHDMNLCRECAVKRMASCTGCDPAIDGRYTGKPQGICSKCRGSGTVGFLFKSTCSQCHGSGKCPWCRGVGWVRLY